MFIQGTDLKLEVDWDPGSFRSGSRLLRFVCDLKETRILMVESVFVI